MATLVPAPAGVMPKVPEGFKVEVFASGLNEPRVIRITPNGDIFVAESASDSGTGRVFVFPADGAGQGKPETCQNLIFTPPYAAIGIDGEIVRESVKPGPPSSSSTSSPTSSASKYVP